jgi:hypothetical protein
MCSLEVLGVQWGANFSPFLLNLTIHFHLYSSFTSFTLIFFHVLQVLKHSALKHPPHHGESVSSRSDNINKSYGPKCLKTWQ